MAASLADAPRELVAQSTAATYVFLDTVQPVARELLVQLPGVHDLSTVGSGFRFCSTDVTRTLTGLMNLLDTQGVQIAELHVQKATLEDVLIELTDKSRQA